MSLLAGCSANGGDNNGTTPPPATTEITASVPEDAGGLDLRPIVWTDTVDGATGEPGSRLEVVPRDTTLIHATVETGSIPAGTTFEAVWSFNDEVIPELTTTLEVAEPRRAGWIGFDLTWTGATYWPQGTLSVEITASTGESVRSSVEIQ